MLAAVAEAVFPPASGAAAGDDGGDGDAREGGGSDGSDGAQSRLCAAVAEVLVQLEWWARADDEDGGAAAGRAEAGTRQRFGAVVKTFAAVVRDRVSRTGAAAAVADLDGRVAQF